MLSSFYNSLLVLHVILICSIILLVILQKSADASILSSSNKFRPGELTNAVIKVTYFLIFAFCVNSIAMLYVKGRMSKSQNSSSIMQEIEKSSSIPVN